MRLRTATQGHPATTSRGCAITSMRWNLAFNDWKRSPPLAQTHPGNSRQAHGRRPRRTGNSRRIQAPTKLDRTGRKHTDNRSICPVAGEAVQPCDRVQPVQQYRKNCIRPRVSWCREGDSSPHTFTSGGFGAGPSLRPNNDTTKTRLQTLSFNPLCG